MQHFIGPVKILKGGRQWAPRHDGGFPFVSFAGLGHESLFDKVEYGMPLLRSELGV